MAENGIIVIVGNWLVEKLVETERSNEEIMKVKVFIKDGVWEVISWYCQQISTVEKQELYELRDRIVTKDKVIIGGHFNGHVVK